MDNIRQTAERIHNFLPTWDRADFTIEETEEEIRKNPIDCINFLLDLLEEA